MPKGIPRNPTVQKKILHRLKIARGHLDAVIEMTEKEQYCIDILNQSLAVQSALKSVNTLILTNHLNTCIRHAAAHGEFDEAIKEIGALIQKT